MISLILRRKFVIKIVGDFSWETSRRNGWIHTSINEFQNSYVGIKPLLLTILQKFIVHRAHKIIVPSYYLKKIVLGWSNKSNIIVVQNAVELKFKSDLFNKKIEKGVIITVCRLVPWKRVDIIIKAIKNDKNYKLWICGSGTDEPSLKLLVSHYRMNDQVTFYGDVNKDKLYGLYNRAEYLILLSEYEGFSHVLLEGLSAKCKVIASAVGGNSEIIKNKINGILISNKVIHLQRALILAEKTKFNYELPKLASTDTMITKTLKILLIN